MDKTAALFDGADTLAYRGAEIQMALREERGRFMADYRITPPPRAMWRSAGGAGIVSEVWASRGFDTREEAERWLAREPRAEIDMRAG